MTFHATALFVLFLDILKQTFFKIRGTPVEVLRDGRWNQNVDSSDGRKIFCALL